MKQWVKIVSLLAIAFLILTGIYSPSMAAQSGPRVYKKVLKKWTKHDQRYKGDDLHAAILWSATLISDEMLDAQVDYKAQVYNLPDSEKETVRAELEKRKGNGTLYFVSFYTHDRFFNDLSAQNTPWDLRLKVGDNLFKSARVDKIAKVDPVLKLYFPYLTPWSTGYYVFFDTLVEPHQKQTLSIHSPYAASHLVWP